MGNISLAAVEQKDPVVNRVQRMASCDANVSFSKNGRSLDRLVLLYGLAGFVCVLGFQHVVSQVFHIHRNVKSIKIKIRMTDIVLFVC